MFKQIQLLNEKNPYRLFFKAFSNTTRLEIIKLLKKRPLTVKEICEITGFEQSRVSHNLKCLYNCGFVRVEKNGIFRKYSLNEDIIALINILEEHIERYRKNMESCEVIGNNNTGG